MLLQSMHDEWGVRVILYWLENEFSFYLHDLSVKNNKISERFLIWKQIILNTIL